MLNQDRDRDQAHRGAKALNAREIEANKNTGDRGKNSQKVSHFLRIGAGGNRGAAEQSTFTDKSVVHQICVVLLK